LTGECRTHVFEIPLPSLDPSDGDTVRGLGSSAGPMPQPRWPILLPLGQEVSKSSRLSAIVPAGPMLARSSVLDACEAQDDGASREAVRNWLRVRSRVARANGRRSTKVRPGGVGRGASGGLSGGLLSYARTVIVEWAGRALATRYSRTADSWGKRKVCAESFERGGEASARDTSADPTQRPETELASSATEQCSATPPVRYPLLRMVS
jgi:hypothetical protein